jgi:hypothetical protein
LPFFSNCRGYGSYVPIFDLFENPQYCSLVPLEKTKIVSQTDFFETAISDECSSQLLCSFEEDVSKPSTNGVRWFDIKGNQVLFYLSTYPVPYDQINLTTTPNLFPGNIEAIAGLFDTSFRGVDVVPVRASRDTSGKAGLPRTVAFTVYYHQVRSRRPPSVNLMKDTSRFLCHFSLIQLLKSALSAVFLGSTRPCSKSSFSPRFI